MRIPLPILQVFTFGLLAFFCVLLPSRAYAVGQEVCNETSYVIYLSTGLHEGDNIRTEGWVRLRSGQCRIVLPAPFTEAPYYAYGYSSDVHAGGRHQWGGRTALCVDETGNFSLDGKQDCKALGLTTRNFNVIDVNPPDGGRTVLSEPNKYGTRAELAGIQRLLKDNGYSVRTVDGYDGRRTRAAIRKFVSTRKLPPALERTALIDALEAAAREGLAQTGLKVCNETATPIWTAYGRHKGRGWESRGWWQIAPKACTTLLSGRLADKSIYLYAGIEGGQEDLSLLAARDNFCVSDVLFAIQGREKCSLRGYQKRPFMLYKNETGKGISITLRSEDFGKRDVMAGLRR